MSRKLFITIALILGLIAAFFIYRNSRSSQAAYNPQTDTLVRPKVQTITETLKLAGSVDAHTKSNLRFSTPGLMTWVGVKVGDRVKKYQALASLDQRQLQKQLEREANNYRSSLSTFLDTESKYQPTRDKSLITDEIKRILERNQNNLNNSVVTYELADLAKRLAYLTTPVSGIVTRIDQPFAPVSVSGADTIEVVDPTSLFFASQLEQEDLNKIHLAQPAQITIDSYPDETLTAAVDYVSFAPIAGQSNIVYEVRFDLKEIKNDNLKYRLGLTGDAVVTIATKPQALTLPLTALVSDTDQNYVWVKSPAGELVKTPVVTGLETDDLVEITKGVSINDQVVIRQTD